MQWRGAWFIIYSRRTDCTAALVRDPSLISAHARLGLGPICLSGIFNSNSIYPQSNAGSTY